MTKVKKIAALICVLAFLIGGLWFYWEQQLIIGDLIPDSTWTRLELRKGTAAGSGEEIVYDAPLEPLLTRIKAASVTRDEENRLLSDQHFQIILYNGNTYPTMLYVKSNGEVHIAVQLDFDHWKHYEDGEELYAFLLDYCESLPAEVYTPQ